MTHSMKRIASLLAASVALFLFSTGLNAQIPGDTDPRLKKQWDQLDKAVKADLPKDAKVVLAEIKAKAKEIDAPWDFYNACMMNVSNDGRINWKWRVPAGDATWKEIRNYGCPIMTFCITDFSMESGPAFLRANKDTLVASEHRQFYSKLPGGYTSGLVKPSLKNDYEFCVWYLVYSGHSFTPAERYYAGSYPMEAYLAYEKILREAGDLRKSHEDEFLSKYNGKAVCEFVRMDRLERRFQELNNDRGSKPSAYLALRNDAEALHKRVGKYSGTEADIAAAADRSGSLIESLEAKWLNVNVKDRNVTVLSSNVSSCILELVRDKNVIYKTRLDSKAKPFFVPDTLKCTLPVVDDGEYVVKCRSAADSDIATEAKYSRYTLSLALREDADGWGCFVADYATGEPVRSYDLEILKPSGKVMYSGKGLVQNDGFVHISYDIPRKRKADMNFRVSCRQNGVLRSSPKSTIYNNDWNESVSRTPDYHCMLLTDRGAYNPGDTVWVKCITWSGTYERKVLSDIKDATLFVRLYDAEGEDGPKFVRSSVNNLEYGSISGYFVIPGKVRGGMWRVAVSNARDNGIEESKFIRVDEFVLPTFDVEWEKDERIYFPEDSIVVRGRLRSYSGHSLSEARVGWRMPRLQSEEFRDVRLAADGSFEIGFRASKEGWERYPITLKVTDSTGETHEFSTERYSGMNLYPAMSLVNACPGDCLCESGVGFLLDSDYAEIDLELPEYPSLEARWELLSKDKKVTDSGEASPGRMKIDMSACPSGAYRIVVKVKAVSDNGKEYARQTEMDIFKVLDTDNSLDSDIAYLFKDVAGPDIAVQAGSTQGPLWIVAELFGPGKELLAHKLVRLSGKKGARGSLERISFEKKADWPEEVSMHLLTFKRGQMYTYTRRITIPRPHYVLPLSFARFSDMARPGKAAGIQIATAPEVECAVSIYDKSTETIQGNRWSARPVPSKPVSHVDYSWVAGYDRSQYIYYARNGAKGMNLMAKAGANGMAVMDFAEDAVEEECMVFSASTESAEAPAAPVTVRENFAKTIAWEPMLRSDSEGNVSFSFVPGDKLSTFYVQVFAHDRKFNNNVLRREMMVTIPVKVSVVQPQFLYEGDSYVAKVSLSNNLKTPVAGKVSVSLYEGDYRTGRLISTKYENVEVAAGGSLAVAMPCDDVDITGNLGVLVRFDAAGTDYASDAMFVSIPVAPAAQMITEAHSALLKSDQDKDALVAELRSRFRNFDGSLAEVSERSIRAMLAEALPALVEPDGCNAISLSEAVYAGSLAARLNATSPSMDNLITKLSACRNEDGGFAWFKDQRSSAMVTAVVLERCASCPEFRQALGEDVIKAAVMYLDRNYFHTDTLPEWCGGISFEQYLHVRARYPDVAFQTKCLDADKLAGFRKAASKYLAPGKVKGLNGQILLKARRVQTIRSLVSSEAGLALARSWSIRFATGRRLGKQIEADMRSLLQYAVEHESGGWYYPNAVMPWRGLMESELYAHSLLCDLLTDVAGSGMPEIDGVKLMDIADGIRLWIMVQKETQKWYDDPAYIEALSSVFHGTEALLDTKVVVLKGSAELPFPEIKAAGNGMTIERRFLCNGKTVGDGDSLKVGDRLTAEYVITNAENRSFVRIKAWRPASFRPVNQLSGYYGGWCVPYNLGRFMFTPQGHRDVYSDRTEYWFNSFAEGNTTVSEEFFVTQEGCFQVPVVEVESLYAPHYRANGSGCGPVSSFDPVQQ